MRGTAFALALLLLLLPLTTGSAAAAEGEEMGRGLHHVRIAGDLDGDGLTDTIGVETNPPVQDTPPAAIGGRETVVTARRGTDGTPLWRVESTGRTVLPARVGAGGRAGVLIVDGPTVDSSSGGATAAGSFGAGLVEVDGGPLTLTAIDGASGATAWTRTFDPGAYAAAAAATPTGQSGHAVVAESLTAFVALLEGGVADRFLITIVTRRDTPAGITSTNRAVVVDGVDGAKAAASTLTTENTRPLVRAAGDLNGDGLDDFVFLRTAAGTGIKAVDATTGNQLWANTDVAVPSYPTIHDIADLTSDGREELLLTGTDNAAAPVPSANVIDGADGSVALYSPAGMLLPVGDVNADGRSELVASTAGPDSVAYQLLELDGTVLIARSHRVTVPAEATDPRVATVAGVGDVNDDGFADLGHELSYRTDAIRRETSRTLVSGRTLALIRSPAAGVPLGRPVAGAIGDFLDLQVSESEVAIALLDGVTGASPWTHRVPNFLAGAEWGDLAAETADLTGDGISDVVVNVRLTAPACTTVEHEETGCVLSSSTTSRVRTYVLSGALGTLHWES